MPILIPLAIAGAVAFGALVWSERKKTKAKK